MRLGIDVGGTFTDLVLIDDDSQRIHLTKTLTTPENLAQGVLTGIEKIQKLAGFSQEELDYIVHGTTIGTNALIERNGAKVGLITTAGFRDVLEIARIERPDEGLYDIFVDLPSPLVPRYLRLEGDERIGADGSVVKALDEKSVEEAVKYFKEVGVEAIAICYLFSFRNPTHEKRSAEICMDLYPQIPVTLSIDVAPEFREFERTSTIVINAYLLPITKNYIDSLVSRLTEKFGQIDLRILQASGGSMTADVAKSHAVHMVNSGPGGGALAAGLFGALVEESKIISLDMGGTSFDVSLVINGQPRVKSEGDFEGFPVKIPMIDVEGIGAGGGSIAWVDAGSALNVGPRSAGSDPGPACYGRGGELPTVTDANLILGRLNPAYFLGAEMPLYVDLAREAIRKHVAKPLKLSVEEAAAGIIRVVNASMIGGINANTTQAGFDVREFSLLAFGGAGPLHTVEMAQEIGAQRVIIPPYCSVFSAFGAVVSDVRHDFSQTIVLSQEQASAKKLQGFFDDLEEKGKQMLKRENISQKNMGIQRLADIRYKGQSYELSIPIRQKNKLKEADIAQLISDFHAYHKRVYEYGDPTEKIEFINLRIVARGSVPKIDLRKDANRKLVHAQPKENRKVYFSPQGFLDTPIYERATLKSGQKIMGQCLIEEATSTSVIPPGWKVEVDKYENLMVTLAGDQNKRLT